MLQHVAWHDCYAIGQLEGLCRPAERMLRSCTEAETHTYSTRAQTQRKVWKTCGCCTTDSQNYSIEIVAPGVDGIL
jgi:hypothetical protein